MTHDKHQFDGIGRITAKTLPASSFEQLLLDSVTAKLVRLQRQEIASKLGGRILLIAD